MNGDTTARVALQAEIDSAIADIKDAHGTGSCRAHDAVCRGLIVLLRCQSASLGQDVKTAAISGTVAAVVSGVVVALAKYF